MFESLRSPDNVSLADLFNIVHESYWTCSVCRRKRCKRENNFGLTIRVKGGTLSTALNEYYRTCQVPDYDCAACETKRDAESGVEVVKLPPVLVLYLKRTEWSKKQQRSIKTRVNAICCC